MYRSKPTTSNLADIPEELLTSDTVSGNISVESLNFKKQKAEERLLEIHRQGAELERQRKLLSELSRKQSEFEAGRSDILEHLDRGVVILEQQQYDMRKEIEIIELIHKNFLSELDSIKSINKENWAEDSLDEELTRSLALVDKAKAIYLQGEARLQALKSWVGVGEGQEEDFENPSKSSRASKKNSQNFFLLMITGFAYTLPLIITLLALWFFNFFK